MPTLIDLPYSLVLGTALALGLALGSFLNVVIYRLPRGQNLARPASHCPACGVPIKVYDNLPVLGWLLLRGKARCCGVTISARYPLVELLGGLMAWAIVQIIILELPPETPWWRVVAIFFAYLVLGLGLVAAAFIDLEHMILPDEITIGGAVLGILSAPIRPDATLLESLIGATIGFGIIWLPFDLLYRNIRGTPGMGLGDAKLTMLAGAWFGWPGAVFALLAGAVQGTIAAIVVFVAQGRIEEPEAVRKERAELLEQLARSEGEERLALERELALDPIATEPEPGLGKARLAFGPFLALASIEYMLFGKWLVRDYLRVLWS